MGSSPSKLPVKRPEKRPLETVDDCSLIEWKKPKVNAVEALQLIDINDHCLWHIFELLDVNDLVSLADAHHRFIPAAVSVFRRLYRKMKEKMVVNLAFARHLSNDSFLCPSDEKIEAFFFHFGHLISKALISFMDQKGVDIVALLQSSCADTIVELNLIFFDENHFQNIDKPFTKLEKLTIIEATLSQQLSQMNKWFPNLQSLELVHVKLLLPELLEVNFPQLAHLEIYSQELDLPIKSIQEMLRKNTQLTSLTLQCDYNREFIESLSRNVPVLQQLQLWSPEDRFLNFHDHKIHFGMVKKFTLNASMSRGDFLVNVPFTFGALQELGFDGFNQFKGQILDFVMQCTDVNKLQLTPYTDDWDDLMLSDLRNVINTLPKLTDIEFCADAFTMDAIIDLLTNSKQLDKVNLLFMDGPWCSQFEDVIQREWDLSKEAIEKHNSNGNITYIQFSLKRKYLESTKNF